MDSIYEGYFEKKYERRIESFEIETLLGLIEIIDKMHKHSIEDYKNAIDNHLNDENGKITDERKFEKVYSEQFELMFEHIAEEFKHRLTYLKSELIKKLDIKSNKKLDVIPEESESDNESDNESNNEGIKKIPELQPGMIIGKYKYMGLCNSPGEELIFDNDAKTFQINKNTEENN